MSLWWVFYGVVCLVAMGVRVSHFDGVDGRHFHEKGLLAASERGHWVLFQQLIQFIAFLFFLAPSGLGFSCLLHGGIVETDANFFLDEIVLIFLGELIEVGGVGCMREWGVAICLPVDAD